jgi:hypothetical protein
MQVGQQSLAVFAASMVLARLLGAVLDLLGRGPWAAVAVNLTGMAIIIGVARLVAAVKAKPWKQGPVRTTTPDRAADPGLQTGVRP